HMHRFAILMILVAALLPVAPVAAADRYDGPIIDMHLHSYGDDYWGGRTHRSGQPSPATAAAHQEQTRKQMDANRVELAAVSGTAASVSTYAEADSRFLRGLSYHGELPSPEVFEELIRAGKIQIFGEIGSVYYGKTLADPEFAPYLKLCEQYDIPVAYHTGGAPQNVHRARPDFRLAMGDPFLIEDVLVRHPNLRVYLMHAGEVYYEHAIRLMAMFPNVYADLGVLLWVNPLPQSYAVSFLERARAAGMLDRVMFGTDQMVWPGAIGASVDFLNGLDFLTGQEKADIFYNNAYRFLRLDKKAGKPQPAASPQPGVSDHHIQVAASNPLSRAGCRQQTGSPLDNIPPCHE
ncbi:MAG: amidohydrolase family protein, partial [Gammaproteobacteria bacterium]|nr:amidohydrolase family protein [Gammaproteobacteria bacterium]